MKKNILLIKYIKKSNIYILNYNSKILFTFILKNYDKRNLSKLLQNYNFIIKHLSCFGLLPLNNLKEFL